MRRQRIASKALAILPVYAGLAISRVTCDEPAPSSSSVTNCRYVVVGSEGVAGSSALEVLRQHASFRRDVMGIDPISMDSASRHTVESLDVPNKMLTLSNGSKVRFEHVLIATGRTIPRSDSERASLEPLGLGELEGLIDPVLLRRKHATFAEDPFVVGELTKKVSRGEHITILGGSTTDIKVIELALKLASAGRGAGYDNVVSIVCPSSGIMSQQLPRYFSLALNKRLNTLGVEIIRYAQVRYVAGIDALVPVDDDEEDDDEEDEDVDGLEASVSKSPRSKYGKVAIFCSHTYDSLNTASFETDAVALVGTAPIVGIGNPGGKSRPLHFGLRAGLESGTVGGIVCNRSLQAAAGVWLAGDVANLDLGSASLGRGCWSGTEHAKETGRVAALNMLGGSLLYDNIPTDHMVCAAHPFIDSSEQAERDRDEAQKDRSARESGNENGNTSGGKGDDNLMSFSFVGHCSAALDSYGFWWAKRTTPGLPGIPGPVPGAAATSKAVINNAARGNSNNNTGNGASDLEAESAPSTNRLSTGALLQDQLLGYFGLSTKEREIPEDTHTPMVTKGRRAVTTIIPTGSSNSSSSSSSSSSSGSKKTGAGTKGSRREKAKGARPSVASLSLKAPKKVPRVPPLGAGLVFYLGPNNTITGVLLAGLAPSHATGDSDASLAYHELVEYARSQVGERVSPYFEETPVDTPQATGRPSHQQLQQGVFLFGHPGLSNGGRYVSVSAQLEIMASDALRRYDARVLALDAAGASRPACRVVKGSAELQRSAAALMADAQSRVTPVPALREKLASGMANSSSKDRMQAAYSSAMKSNEIKATWNPK